jgi:hypothetical protein
MNFGETEIIQLLLVGFGFVLGYFFGETFKNKD